MLRTRDHVSCKRWLAQGVSGPEFSGPSWFAAALSQPLEASSNCFPTSPARKKLIVSIPALLVAFLV